ncbi:10637_t:CDS:1, partial [Funneliformis geosporum]
LKIPGFQDLAVNLKLYDLLCIKHYNNLVVYDRNTLKLSRKSMYEIDLAYNERGNKAKQVCVLQETYENLLNSISIILQLEQEILELKEKVKDYMHDFEQINDM